MRGWRVWRKRCPIAIVVRVISVNPTYWEPVSRQFIVQVDTRTSPRRRDESVELSGIGGWVSGRENPA